MRNFTAAAMLGIVCATGWWFADAEQANAARPPIEGPCRSSNQPIHHNRRLPEVSSERMAERFEWPTSRARWCC